MEKNIPRVGRHIIGDRFSNQSGGKGSNQAITILQKLECDVNFDNSE
jgi:hypothetical protein